MICQSSTGFNPGARIKNPKKYAYQLCTSLGKYTQNSREILDFLKTVEPQRLVQAQEQIRRKIVCKLNDCTKSIPK